MAQIADKFIREYYSEKDTAKRFDILTDFVNLYYDSDYQKVNTVIEKELEQFIKDGFTDGEALIRYMIAYSDFEHGNIKKGSEGFEKVMGMYDNVKSHSVRAQIMNFVAFLHSHQGNYDKAFQHVYECIREAELANDKRNEFWGVYTLGVFHYDLKDFANAEKCYLQASEGFSKYGNRYGQARSETGLSSIYIQAGKFSEAEVLLNRSLKYYEEMGVTSGQSRSLNDLGIIYRSTKQYEKAFDCFKQSLELRKATNHIQGVATTLNEISELLLELKKYEEAEKYLHEAKLACEKINNRAKLYRTHLLFSRVYRNMNEPWKALEHYEHYDKLKTEVTGETASNKIKELQTKMATEKSEKEAEIERLRNVELKSAYDIIELKNKEITDSINYAQRIQKALLASDGLLKRNLKEHFVFFKPKDIVSGDFYWATEKDGRFYLAVCDSTGHGVPGAFMSLLNISFLNEAITEKGIVRPNEIFNHVRQRLIENVSSEGKDGMDGILLCLTPAISGSPSRIAFAKPASAERGSAMAERGEVGVKIEYAAANNAPMLINSSFHELESNNMPVGLSDRKNSFTLFTIPPSGDKGGFLYLYTDGYADQFGGEKGKKYKYRPLNEKLSAICNKPLTEQKNILETTFNEWKGNLEQVDDVLVIGIKI